jgi:hypothetical protein
MRRRDQLDATLAKQFAWCFAPPGAPLALAEIDRRLRVPEDERNPDSDADAAISIAADDHDLARAHERARNACRALAQAVGEAWLTADDDASARATKRLLVKADRLGVEVVGMDPAEAVKLVRLLVRHAGKMTRRQRDRSAAVSRLLSLDHPDVALLFEEIARSGDEAMADALLSDEDWEPQIADRRDLGTRLAAVIDEGPTHACRAVALALVARLDACEAALPALRRALRLPSFGVRARALHALASAQPCAVLDEDLVLVLRDLVRHAPPDVLRDEEREEEERLLADAVLAALRHVQPADAEEALLDLIDAEHETVWLDEAWATEALAVAFPETAAVMVDHWLKCTRTHERTRAMAAIERLPNDLAEPRLLRAASDPAFAVRDAARKQWLDRYGSVCPLRIGDLPGAALLAGLPSARFASRLGVMHGRVRDARRAMARALLAEAPDPEALVLLLQLVGDDSDSAEPNFGSRDEAWASIVVERFGAAGVEGLCALAARFTEPESFGWMRRLGDLVERGTIAREHAGPLRALAAAQVASDDAARVDDAIRVLAQLGAPPELFDRILTIALDEDFGSSEARTLVIGWPDRSVDVRLASEMAMALAERDWTRLRYAARVALERGSPAGRVIAQRVLEVAENDAEATDAAVECARQLRVAGQLDDGWARGALARPESSIFAVAARAWRGEAVIRSSLDAALTSRARAGASAAQAAIGLLHGEPRLSPRDRRLSAILESAAGPERAELVHALCMHGAPLSLVGPHLDELLASADPSVTSALIGVAVWVKSPKGRALLRAALPRVVDFELRADIEDVLGTAPAPFWAEG